MQFGILRFIMRSKGVAEHELPPFVETSGSCVIFKLMYRNILRGGRMGRSYF